MIHKLQLLKGKTKIKFYQLIGRFYDEMLDRNRSNTFQFEENPFTENVGGFSKNYHEVLLFLSFLQFEPQVRNMSGNYFDLYYTVKKSRDEKEIVDDDYRNNEIEYNNYK